MVAPAAVGYLYLQYRKMLVRKEIKWRLIAGIDRKELVLLKFRSSEQHQLKWKHAREFEYRGELYDIVETISQGDTTFYWCWWDNEETQLHKKLTELVSKALKGDPKRNKNQQDLLSFFKTPYYASPPQNGISDTICSKIHRAKWMIRPYHTLLDTPPSPPPEV